MRDGYKTTGRAGGGGRPTATHRCAELGTRGAGLSGRHLRLPVPSTSLPTPLTFLLTARTFARWVQEQIGSTGTLGRSATNLISSAVVSPIYVVVTNPLSRLEVIMQTSDIKVKQRARMETGVGLGRGSS